MKFGDYIKVLKKSFANGISNQELCILLFDSIIQPLDLRGSNNESLNYNKGRISEFVNNKKPIPQAIRDGYNDNKVTESIIDYFQANIVSELIPDKNDLCFQLMQLIEVDNTISPINKSSLRMLATHDTIAPFLAQTFGYALRGDGPQITTSTEFGESQTTTQPALSLAGIISNEAIKGQYTFESIQILSEEKHQDYLAKIDTLFEDIASIPIQEKVQSFETYQGLLSGRPMTISENDEEFIRMIANARNYPINDDFFNLNGLYNNYLQSSLSISGAPFISGPDELRHKYKSIRKLIDIANEAFSYYDIMKFFDNYKVLRLALRNDGTCVDQSINITLHLPIDSFVTSDDILEKEDYILDYLLYDFLEDASPFVIQRTIHVFDYSESFSIPRPFHGRVLDTPTFPINRSRNRSTDDYRRALSTVFEDYFIEKEGSFYSISISFDEILHNTAIAFPTVILLSKEIETIKYEIRSRSMADIIHGELTLAIDSNAKKI